MAGIFEQGFFTVGQDATPEDLERKRQRTSNVMQGTPRYALGGLGKLAAGIVGGVQERNMSRHEGEQRTQATELFERIMGGAAPQQLSTRTAPMGASTPPVSTGPIPDTPQAVGADTRAALGLPQGDTASRIRSGLVSRGLPEHIADGFVMNFQDESGLDSGINEASPLVPGSRGGFGLYQLTGPRRREYEAYAESRGVPLDSEDAQMDFLMQELQGSESRAAETIMSTRTAGEAGAAIVNDFLRPSPEHRERRANRYMGGGGSSSGGGPARPSGNQGPSPQDLMQMMSNPWLSSDQKAVLGSMLGQAQQNADPMRQIQMETAQLELDRLRNPQAAPGYTQLSPQEAASMGLTDGSYQRSPDGKISKIGGGGVNVTVGGASEVGTIPTGYQMTTDPATGERSLSPLAGGPEDTTLDQTAAAAAAMDSVQLIDSIIDSPELPGITGMVQGRLPPMSQDGTDLNVKIQQVQGQAFLQAFESLKGGGSITEREGQAAQAAMARLNRAQSTQAYTAALQELKDIILRGVGRANGTAPAVTDGGGLSDDDMQYLGLN